MHLPSSVGSAGCQSFRPLPVPLAPAGCPLVLAVARALLAELHLEHPFRKSVADEQPRVRFLLLHIWGKMVPAASLSGLEPISSQVSTLCYITTIGRKHPLCLLLGSSVLICAF